MPPTMREAEGKDVLNNAYEALLKDTMHCWVLSEGNTVYAIATTTFTQDKCAGVKSLLVYSLFGFKNIPRNLWKEGIEAIRSFARGKGCDMISAFTSNKRVLQIAEELGGNTEEVLIKFKLE